MTNKLFRHTLDANASISAAYTKMLKESTDSEDDSDSIHQGWRERVKAAHPDKNLVFRSKSSGGEMMISAEEQGDKERTCHGLFNMKTNEAQVFHGGLHEETYDQGTPSEITHFGRKFSTLAFDGIEDANKFMSSDVGSQYGHISTDASGKHHLAMLSDKGTAI